MADWLVYWKRYWEETRGATSESGRHLSEWGTRSRWFYDRVRPGDRLWVIIRATSYAEDQWRLLERVTVRSKRRDRAEKVYPYAFPPIRRATRRFDLSAQPDLGGALRKLRFASDTPIKGQGVQIGMSLQTPRLLAPADVDLLSTHARLLSRPQPFHAPLTREEQERAMEDARRRKRDRMLRTRVLDWWGPACAACGMTLAAASSRTDPDRYECEVAHLEPVRKEAPDALNTMPLCRTHHWAYDRQLWAIQPGDFRLHVRSTVRRHPSLRALHGRSLREPQGPHVIAALLSSRILQRRWNQFPK